MNEGMGEGLGRGLAGRRWATMAVVVLVCWVGQSFARFSFGLLLPAMKSDLRVSYGLAGWLGTINLAGYLVGTVVTSAASLRVPAHRLMQIGVTLATVGMVILTFAQSMPLLLVAMAVSGVGGAAGWIPAPVVAASVFPAERRALAMGMTSGAIGLGIVVATFLTRGVRGLGDDQELWRPIWMIQAAVGVVAVVLALVVLRPIATMPGATPKLSVLRQVPKWWAPTTAYAFFGIGYVLFSTFVVSALEADAGFSTRHAATIFALIGAGNATGALTVGRFVERIGQRATMASAFSLAGVACLAVLNGHEPWVSIATFCFGFGMAGGVVSITSYLGGTVRPQDFSAAFGVMTACFGVTQTVGPRLGGWIADTTEGFRWVFLLAAGCWFLGAACSLGLPRREDLPVPH